MATAEQFISLKGGTVASLGPGATVLEASRLMNDRGIGSVMVIDNDRLVGIFTERDVLRRVVAEQRDPATTKLADVMTSPVPPFNEMFRVFNMGVGFVLMVRPAFANSVVRQLTRLGEIAVIMGEIAKGSSRVRLV